MSDINDLTEKFIQYATGQIVTLTEAELKIARDYLEARDYCPKNFSEMSGNKVLAMVSIVEIRYSESTRDPNLYDMSFSEANRIWR